MPEPERQHYVAYRASADEFEVRFYGGPLDGARIRTDVFPDCSTFSHRVRDRSYTYRYQRVSNLRFDATLVTNEMIEESAATPESRIMRVVMIATVTLVIVTTAVTLWQLAR